MKKIGNQRKVITDFHENVLFYLIYNSDKFKRDLSDILVTSCNKKTKDV